MSRNESLIHNIKTPANGIHTPLTRVLILISIRLFSTNFYAFICFANFSLFASRSHIPGCMYFTGFTVTFDYSRLMTFEPYPPNYIWGENSFCFLKFLVAYFSNLGDSHFSFGGYWGIKFFPQIPTFFLFRYFYYIHFFNTFIISVQYSHFPCLSIYDISETP